MAGSHWRCRALPFLVGCRLLLTIPAQVLDVSVESATGDFSITHNGQQWLVGGEVQVGNLSARNGTLRLKNATQSMGQDAIGWHSLWAFQWASSTSPDDVLIETTLRSYPTIKGVVIFEQHFPSAVDLRLLGGGGLADSPQRSAATQFPAFGRNLGPSDALACFSYHGVFPSLRSCSNVSGYAESRQGGAPLVLYNATDDSLPMLVFSPLNFPKAQHMFTTATSFGIGAVGSVEMIPAGWRQSSILTAGKGITDGMMGWGDFVLKWTGKQRADMYGDEILSGIGFWTDNGGYYHYSTGVDRNKTYEEVLPMVKAYHDEIGVPFRHWQFDSWFYPKDGTVAPGGGGPAVTNWTAMDSVFPHGMQYIQSKLQLPMAMHNRQWSPNSDYIKNLAFEWYTSEKAAVPKDPPAFFTWFFQQQEGWGLKMYEQDWMCTEYDEVKELQTNISMGDLWLRGMAEGAARNNKTIQYCMPYTYDLLSAAWYPAVTNARASGDYFHDGSIPQWTIGGTAMYYWAIGILPFKDGFYSSTNKQVGGETVGPEMHPDREAIMATLSCATVGPMDGIHLLNASRVMATCRKDGLVLKPDRPVTTSDWCFRSRYWQQPAELCWVFQTFSEPVGSGAVHYLYMDSPLPFSPDMVHLPPGANVENSSYMIYNWYTGELTAMRTGLMLAPGYEGHVYALVTPVQSGWAFLGEVDKYAAASRTRFPELSFEPIIDSASRSLGAEGSGARLRVAVRGAAGESVRVCAAEAATGVIQCQASQFGPEEEVKAVLFTPSSQSLLSNAALQGLIV